MTVRYGVIVCIAVWAPVGAMRVYHFDRAALECSINQAQDVADLLPLFNDQLRVALFIAQRVYFDGWGHDYFVYAGQEAAKEEVIQSCSCSDLLSSQEILKRVWIDLLGDALIALQDLECVDGIWSAEQYHTLNLAIELLDNFAHDIGVWAPVLVSHSGAMTVDVRARACLLRVIKTFESVLAVILIPVTDSLAHGEHVLEGAHYAGNSDADSSKSTGSTDQRSGGSSSSQDTDKMVGLPRIKAETELDELSDSGVLSKSERELIDRYSELYRPFLDVKKGRGEKLADYTLVHVKQLLDTYLGIFDQIVLAPSPQPLS